MQYYITFKLTKLEEFEFDDGEYILEKWTPSIVKPIPPQKGLKYLVYYFFLLFGVFRNSKYFAFSLIHNDVLVSSLLVVPAYYKWPFMKPNDVQITYVMTHPHHRGKAYASRLIYQVIHDLRGKVSDIWYVTDTNNMSSLRLAEKMGFKNVGRASNSSIFKILRIIN